MNKIILILFGILQTYAAFPYLGQFEAILKESRRTTPNESNQRTIHVNANLITSLLNTIFGNSTQKTVNVDVDGILESVQSVFRSKGHGAQEIISDIPILTDLNEPPCILATTQASHTPHKPTPYYQDSAVCPSVCHQRPQEPEVVKFRSNQPSLMFEVNANAILNAINKFVNSDTLVKYTEVFAKKAANVLRTIADDTDIKISATPIDT